MIGIVHCGAGNIASVANAIEHLGGNARIVQVPEDLEDCERIILPGVGSFFEVMGSLVRDRFDSALKEHVVVRKKPTLGICLGMQLMAELGTEGGSSRGLGWFDATVEKVATKNASERIPHVGWNHLTFHRAHALLSGVPAGADFYFVHSYTMRLRGGDSLIASCDYADGVTAIVGHGNIFATQFHPEKSQDHGLKILENFLDWTP